MRGHSRKRNRASRFERHTCHIFLFRRIDDLEPGLRTGQHGTRCRDIPVWRLRIVEPRLVLFQVDDQLCGAGRQDPLERVRPRATLIHPDRCDERVERRPRNAVTVVHDGSEDPTSQCQAQSSAVITSGPHRAAMAELTALDAARPSWLTNQRSGASRGAVPERDSHRTARRSRSPPIAPTVVESSSSAPTVKASAKSRATADGPSVARWKADRILGARAGRNARMRVTRCRTARRAPSTAFVSKASTVHCRLSRRTTGSSWATRSMI